MSDPFRLKYVGGLEAVVEGHQVVSHGGVVEVTDPDRAADMASSEDWELLDDRKPRRSKAAREAAAEVVGAPDPDHEGG